MSLEELIKARTERLLQAYTPDGELKVDADRANLAGGVIAGVIEHNRELWALLHLVFNIGYHAGIEYQHQIDGFDPETIPF